MGKFPDIKQIIRDPTHDMPRFRIVKKAERLFLYMAEQLTTHIGLDIDPEFMPKVVDDELHQCTDDVEC